MIADMHRVRHLAWELPKLGWEVEVLYPGAEFQRPEYIEPDSVPLFNPATPLHEVRSKDPWFFRLLGIRSIGWRAFRPLLAAGYQLIKRRRFDLIYISTANFPLFCLGRSWARRFGIPYVLDYHDPWVRDRINYSTTESKWKALFVAKLSRWMERYAIQRAAGIVSVSSVYLEELRRRYGELKCLRSDRTAVIPFAARKEDSPADNPSRESHDEGRREIIYVGAGGSIMAKSFSTICEALAELKRSDPILVGRVKIRLFGTYAYWEEGDPKPLQDIATEFGLEDIVEEMPARISHHQTMELLQRCHGLLILGVDDAGYIPSKLFMYAFSGKPLLASFLVDSSVARLFSERSGLGHLITFGANLAQNSRLSVQSFLREVNDGRRFDRHGELAGDLSAAMAQRHARLFELICARG